MSGSKSVETSQVLLRASRKASKDHWRGKCILVNDEEKQEFKDKSWIFPLICLSLLVGLAILPLGRSSPEEKVVRARAKAEVLAYQVAQLYKESLVSSEDFATTGRGPASVRAPIGSPSAATPAEGLMGQDPWGQAYRYRIVAAEDGKVSVEMRSLGPSGGVAGRAAEDIVINLSF
ncbi:MAG: hypothetical protein KF789_03750 [Bdellovibrionaceae bacterium]|nr:hypothetical protein [Pseudobdellovibrionaceae bacterium]